LGLGNVPRLAGLHPIYIVRQLYLFKDGFRNGPDAQLMKKPVEKLTDEDIVSISAYLGSGCVCRPDESERRTLSRAESRMWSSA
jgi:cytochrome c553